jgi:Flp pilus assembly protein TadB
VSDRPAWAALLLAAALLVWSPRAGRTARRLRGLRPPDRAPVITDRRLPDRGRRLAWGAGAGLAVGLLLGGATGLVAGVAVAGAVPGLLGRWTATRADPLAAARSADLPVACDLLAVTLAAGLPVGEALSAVGAALPEPLGPELRRVAALYRFGAEPRHAWADAPPELAVLARALVRAGESGSAVAPALRALAAEARTSARAAAATALQRAGVWVLAPLGLCFLPAFVCLGVVPLVLGIAGQVFR